MTVSSERQEAREQVRLDRVRELRQRLAAVPRTLPTVDEILHGPEAA